MPVTVLANIPPVAALAASVAGDRAEVATLLPPGTSPHDFALRPSQAHRLSDADAIVWVGEGLTPQLAGAIETLGAEATVITLSDVPGVLHRARRENIVFEDGDHHDDSDHDHGHDHDHDQSADDPHLWLDPENADAWLSALATRLGQLDPVNAAVFEANANMDIGRDKTPENSDRIELIKQQLQTMVQVSSGESFL